MNVGQRIKQRRESLGLSVDDIARKLGKHRATIYRYESDEIKTLPTDVLEPLAIALRTTPAYLMGWEEAEEQELDPTEQRLREAALTAATIQRLTELTPEEIVIVDVFVQGLLAARPKE